MAKSKKIMAWSKCGFRIAPTPDDESMAADADLKSIGTIKDKSSSLEPEDGDTLEAKATGGILVGRETQEGNFKATTRVIEPDDDLLELLGLGEASDDDDFAVKTHVVEGDFSLEIDPKNVGAKGIRAPKTNITYKPGWSEEEGNYADITFDIIKGDADYWYKRYTKKKAATTNKETA